MNGDTVEQSSQPISNFRLDVPLHELLTKPSAPRIPLRPQGQLQQFPDPVFPRRPELLGPIDENDGWRPPQKRKWTTGQIYHTMQGWLFPYIRSRLTAG